MTLTLAAALWGSTLLAQTGGRHTLEGVWKVTDIAVSGAATFRPIVAKGPNAVFIHEQFTVTGDTLTLSWISSDMHVRIGQDVVQSTAPLSRGRMTLVRVE